MEEMTMLNWKNLDTLSSYAELQKVKAVNLKEVMTARMVPLV